MTKIFNSKHKAERRYGIFWEGIRSSASVRAYPAGIVLFPGFLGELSALLSAKYALDQNRCIFVLPGHPLDSRSHGGNKLIKEGACFVETASDIKKEFPKSIPRMSFCAKEEEETDYLLSCSNTPSFLSIESQTSEHSDMLRLLLERISTVPTSIETLRKELKISSICLQNMLVELELQEYMERYPEDAVVAVPQEGRSCVEAHCS